MKVFQNFLKLFLKSSIQQIDAKSNLIVSFVVVGEKIMTFSNRVQTKN